jgi:hypothetical protein
LPHESISVIPDLAIHIWVAESVLGNVSLSQVYADTQLQITVAVLPQRRVANCKRGPEAFRWVAEESQQPVLLPNRRYQIFRSDAYRRIGEHLMEILR